MGMNPETNRFEPFPLPADFVEAVEKRGDEIDSLLKRQQLIRPDGSPVPKHWSVFAVGELVVIKDYTFRVAYIGETAILFEPVSPIDAIAKEPK